MKKYKYIIYISVICFGIFHVGCSEDDITKLPVTSLFDDQFWTSEEEVEQATNAAYLGLGDARLQMEWDGLTEVIVSQTGTTTEISTGGLLPNSSMVNSLWTGAYSTIRSANWFLDNVDKSGIESSKLAKYKGQWRFVRAWAHYKLLYQFGDVPIVDKVLSIEEGKVSQNTRVDVLSFVITELDQTISELASSDYNPKESGKISKWAAMALKARILLYEGSLAGDNSLLQQSANLSKEIMNNGGFTLHENYTELFRPEGDGSNEIILSRIYPELEGFYHQLGQYLGPITFHAAWSIITPVQALVDKYPDINGDPISTSSIYDPANPFVNRDPRLIQSIFDWTKTTWYEGTEFTSNELVFNFRKFIDPAEPALKMSHNDYILFRLGEVYLNYVEAMNEIGGPNNELLNIINELRIRGGVGAAEDGSDITVNPISVAGLTKDDFREIIRTERVIELVGEGNLYYDYHRWKLLETTMNKPAVAQVLLEDRLFTAPRDYLWPIPEWELINNANLKQNPNW